MLKLVVDNPHPTPCATPRPPTHAFLIGDPNDPDMVSWVDAIRSGLPIVRHAGEFDDVI